MSAVGTPRERIQAFQDALDEELIRPGRRYLRGFRRGIMLGCLLGILFAPMAGSESRGRLRRLVNLGCRLGQHSGS
ncbi:MAG: hypothetical protein ACYDD0_02985 [Candidatus Dormibacteria bacterium]